MSLPTTMRAVRLVGVGKPVEVFDIPVPEPGVGEVLVKVAACGVCASDVHVLDGSLPARTNPPVTMGHEASGTIVALGPGVTTIGEGERVVIYAGKGCGICRNCRAGRSVEECQLPLTMGVDYDGAWADYVAVPATACVRVPDGIPMEQAAILADAVATPFNAVTEVGAVKPGERVAIFGIGGLGTHAVQIARLSGAGYIAAVDPRASARERALALGADDAFDPDGAVGQIRQATNGEGVDAAFDFVGASAVLKCAVQSLAHAGRAIAVGVSGEKISLGPLILFALKQTQLRGTYGYRTRHLEALIRLVQTKRLDISRSITATMSLEEGADAVDALATKRGDPVRLVLVP